MAKALSKKMIPLGDGGAALHEFLDQYQARLYRDSSTDKGHVYWSEPSEVWLLVMKEGKNAQVTFHAADDCPCKMI
jgi:hypothetical protein